MMTKINVYSVVKRSLTDGNDYSVRYLLTEEELIELQSAGIIQGEIAEVIGLNEIIESQITFLCAQVDPPVLH